MNQSRSEWDQILLQEKTTKLLGMTIADNQGWKEHFTGKAGLITSLNKRLFAIRRVANHIPRDKSSIYVHFRLLRFGLRSLKSVTSS